MNYPDYYKCVGTVHVKSQSCGNKCALDLSPKAYKKLMEYVKKNIKQIAREMDI